jgi:hypothetical protein
MKLTDPVLKLFVFAKWIVTLASRFVFSRISFHRRHLLRGILVGFVISVVVTILALLGHFRPYENALTDLLERIAHKKAKDVVLLFITGAEYKHGFHATSPLSRERLANMIDVLVKLKARVIALDIDISDPTHEDEKLTHSLGRAAAAGIPIVVVGNLKETDEKLPSEGNPLIKLRPYRAENAHYTEDGFMLFENASPGSQWIDEVMYGGVNFRLGVDGIFREGEALYMVKKNCSNDKASYRPVPSFPVAVAAAYQGMSQDELFEALSCIDGHTITLVNGSADDQSEIRINLGRGAKIVPNFIGNYEYFNRELDLKGLLEEYGPGRKGNETIFKGKVVIVGGAYDEKDFYTTPLGRMSGMEILANITQNIISGDLITHTNFWKAFVIEVTLGALVALVFVLTSRLWATFICFVTLVPAVAAASLLSFSSSYYWFDFVPTIFGVILHGWVRKVEVEWRGGISKIKSKTRLGRRA